MLDRTQGEPPLEGMTRGEFLKVAGAAGLLVTCSGSVLAVLDGKAAAQVVGTGKYGPPFVEPVIYLCTTDPVGNNGTPVRTDQKCLPKDCGDGRGPRNWCKPAAGSLCLLPDGRLIYWNALEGTENSAAFIHDADHALDNDDSRVLTVFPRPSWLKPINSRGGVRNDQASELLPGLITSDFTQNNGTMFCAHQTHLPDGTILVAGGTHYYTEPATVELEGLEDTRIFDPKLNRWFLTGSMNVGRWYPATCPLETGDVFVCSGVHKLEKPIYGLNGQHPGEPSFTNSFDNNRQTETFDIHSGKWSDNGTSAQRSLPLMPRIHLLPNGHVVFNGAGQAFSPNGQSFLQATWNIVATYNPKTKSWQDVGFAGLPFTLDQASLDAIAGELGATVTGTPPGTVVNNPTELATALTGLLTLPGGVPSDPSNAAGVGSRLSTFEVPLLMEPDKQSGQYDTLELLTAGGTIGGVFFTDPGSYLATNLSRIDTLKTNGDQVAYKSRFTGTMKNRRWFSSGTLLPTGEVFACSGADRDEVIFPGAEMNVKQAEMFDPKTETWKADDTTTIPRTYHNTAILLPDARVLVGGHAPIPTGYLSHTHVSGVDTGLGPNDGREPRFEIYSPPYLQGNSKNRPCIDDPAANWGSSGGSGDDQDNRGHKQHGRHGDDDNGNGQGDDDDENGNGHGGNQTGKSPKAREIKLGESFTVKTCNNAKIDSVVLMRVSSVTHVNDTEQRGIKLLFTQKGDKLTAQMPSQAAVVYPGYWLLFIVSNGVPSVGMLVKVPLQK